MDKVFRILISLIFLASGLAKLLSLDFETAAFARWGYPEGFMYFIGTLEVAGAIGLWQRKLTALAGLGLCVLMLGAAGTHAMHAEWPMLGVACIILLLTGTYTWRHRRYLFPTDMTPPESG